MESVNKAIKMATEAMEARYGDPEMEEGDVEVFIFKNCMLVMKMEEGRNLKMQFTNSEPFKLDFIVGVYESEEEE